GGWSCRCGSPIRTGWAGTAPTSRVRSPRGFAFARWTRPCGTRRHGPQHGAGTSRRPVSLRNESASCSRRGGPAPEPEARREAGQRRDGLLHDEPPGARAALSCAQGDAGAGGWLWIAWPKKASKIESDLSFVSVQQIGLDAGLVDNKRCAIDDEWQAVRFLYRLIDREQ